MFSTKKCQQLFMAASVAMNLGVMVNEGYCSTYSEYKTLEDVELIHQRIDEVREIVINTNTTKNKLCKEYHYGSVDNLKKLRDDVRFLLSQALETIDKKYNDLCISHVYDASHRVAMNTYLQEFEQKDAICKRAINSITAIMKVLEDSYRYSETDTVKMILYNDITC